LCENMDLGRPENVELLFRRGQRLGRASADPPGGGFKTKIDRYCDLVKHLNKAFWLVGRQGLEP
ncbi:MAG TPA: hypothetical protein VHO07_18640, partial [Streptosporangiaceae bacterium]|nr:hypothetical protein [Streptosporangiaceae bacterium]